MNGAPSDHTQISIEEFIKDYSLQIIFFNAADTFGEFRSRDSSAKISDLISQFGTQCKSVFLSHKIVENLVSSSEHFVFGNVLRILSQDELGKEHHLLAVDFISEEVSSEKSRIRIGHVMGLVKSDIGMGSQMFVHQMVLTGRMIQMSTSVLIGAVFAQKRFQVMHSKEFRVFPSRGVEEDTKVSIHHLIISHEKGRRSEIRLFRVLLFALLFGKFERLAGFNYFFMVD